MYTVHQRCLAKLLDYYIAGARKVRYEKSAFHRIPALYVVQQLLYMVQYVPIELLAFPLTVNCRRRREKGRKTREFGQNHVIRPDPGANRIEKSAGSHRGPKEGKKKKLNIYLRYIIGQHRTRHGNNNNKELFTCTRVREKSVCTDLSSRIPVVPCAGTVDR